jgi:hypothetical protein
VRLVLDTNVIVAAMRSPKGASAALLMAARRDKIKILANVALALEYEATCRRAEHGIAAGLRPAQVSVFVDAVFAMVEPVESHFLWRPQLRDPAFVHGIYVCSWIAADLIAFVWDLDAARKTALVSWTEAARLVGHYFKPTTEDPPRIRVDTFPTPDELIELQKVANPRDRPCDTATPGP